MLLRETVVRRSPRNEGSSTAADIGLLLLVPWLRRVPVFRVLQTIACLGAEEDCTATMVGVNVAHANWWTARQRCGDAESVERTAGVP